MPSLSLLSTLPSAFLRRAVVRWSLIVGALALGSIAPRAHGQSRLTNISVRSGAGSGAETLIVGFAVGGSGSRPVLLRGAGPSLVPLGVSDAVADPRLLLYSGTRLVTENDNWGGDSVLSTAFDATGAFRFPASSRDAALLETLSPGSYSVHLVSNSGPGIALVECYDAGSGPGGAYLANLSARSAVGTGSGVLTVGFTISGRDPKPILIRGIGPALVPFGVTGALASPRLRVFDSEGTEIADNAGWTSAVTPASVFSATGAFSLPLGSRDAVVFFALPPGGYTAQVSGVNNTTGTALIEAYEVNASPVPYLTLEPVLLPPLPAPTDDGVGTPSPGPDAVPQVLTQARPQYPFELRLASVTGTALVDFYVKTDGRVANALPIRATDIRLANAAIAAVNAWTFIPGRRSGRLVTTHMQVPIVFSLN